MNKNIKEKINLLKNSINEHNYAYYVLDNPILSDQEYDNLFRELQSLEKNYPEFIDSQSPTQRVGHPVESGFESFNHRIPMLSLSNAITNEEILKISNLAEDYSVSELINNCLSKNLKKTINILNENNYSSEDCILILRTMLIKAKRLLKLKKEVEKSKNIDQVIFSFRPLIFWKEKEIVKKQAQSWSTKEIKKIIYKINDLEVIIKKNSINSINFISDFVSNYQ